MAVADGQLPQLQALRLEGLTPRVRLGSGHFGRTLGQPRQSPLQPAGWHNWIEIFAGGHEPDMVELADFDLTP